MTRLKITDPDEQRFWDAFCIESQSVEKADHAVFSRRERKGLTIAGGPVVGADDDRRILDGDAQAIAAALFLRVLDGASSDDDEMFGRAMAWAVRLNISPTELSNALPVDKQTAQRWLAGEARPKPAMRPAVYSLIRRVLTGEQAP